MIDTDTYPPAIQKALDDLGNDRNKILAEYLEPSRVAEAAMEEFPDLIDSVSVAWHFTTVEAVIVSCRELKNVSEVTPLIRWFAQRGHRQVDEPTDWAEIRRRTWQVHKRIKIHAFFADENAGGVCRYVQTGVKEEPVYELRCGDSQ